MDRILKIVFIPMSVAAGLIAGAITTRIFERIWSDFDEEEAPEPGHREINWPKLIVALLVEGAIFRLVKGITERGSRKGVYKLTGAWPGEERPDPA